MEKSAITVVTSSPVEILVALLRRGVTQHAIAESMNVSDGAVNRVIYGRMKSKRIREEISRRTSRDWWPSG